MLCLAGAAAVRADVGVLVEEPYGNDAKFAGTGHTAVYLTRVCAASPIKLRPCGPGELGAVLSRYHRLGGYDWAVTPLLGYLYAVDRTDQIPLLVDSKLVQFLRDQYRREHLLALVPDDASGQAPQNDWEQLAGSAYDRSSYGFVIETTPEQDAEFIRVYNSRPNRQSYRVVTNNCAHFVRDVVDFFYPGAISRNIWNDLGVMTPYQAGRALARYGSQHPELRFYRFVIPQVPGAMSRSTPVRGLAEVVFKSKKYEIPLLAAPPHVGALFAAAYFIRGRFNPGRGAEILNPAAGLEAPLTAQQRKPYERQLDQLARSFSASQPVGELADWRHMDRAASYEFDSAGEPCMTLLLSGSPVEAGISRNNVLDQDTPEALSWLILVARVRQELNSRKYPNLSAREFQADWQLLERASAERSPVASAVAFSPSAAQRR
jgi:hypothetical protein